MVAIEDQVRKTIGAHEHFGWLITIFKEHLQEAASDIPEMQKKRDQVVHIYLPYLVGITLFTNKSANYVNVTYLKYFRDQKPISDYAWGVVVVTHLYMELNNGSHHKTKHLVKYLNLFEV